MCAYVSNEHGGISEYSPTHNHRGGFEYNKYSRAVLIRSAGAARKARQRYISELPLGERCLKQRCCLKAAMGLRSFPPRLWISRIERRRKTASVRSREEVRGIFFSPESSRCAESRIKTDQSAARLQARPASSLSFSLSRFVSRIQMFHSANLGARAQTRGLLDGLRAWRGTSSDSYVSDRGRERAAGSQTQFATRCRAFLAS